MSVPRLRHPFRAAILGAIALLLTAASSRTTDPGRLEGFVKDNGGAPIANAQVFVVGTAHSALTDARGHYLIAGVTPGSVDLRAAFVGYRPVLVRGVRVVGGQTTRQDFALEASVVEVSALEVTAEKPLVPRDQVTSRAVIVGGANESQGSASRDRRNDAGRTPISSQPLGTNGFVGPTTAQPCCYRQVSPPPVNHGFNTEEYSHIRENGFRPVASAPLSTFSIDVDKASYANVRRFLTQGSLPPGDAVRLEEMINYFTYDLPEPRGEHPFSITTEVGATPWAPQHRLVRIGIQGKRLRGERMPPSNLVFLIDVSGSMNEPNKLPLVKRSLRMLVDQLDERDHVSIVVYAGRAGLALPCTPGTERTRILNAIDNLEAGGSTAGGAGIQLAYRIARENFVAEGNNRVILATDGDFNVGASSEGELVRLIEQERRSGVFLTVLGFGTGNYADARMESLADKGNGNYFYIDNLMEGRKVFVEELQGTLFTIAKDVKIQVEFNPAEVASYRLVGYENRALRDEDFNNDSIDAGELGAGHTVTALYEIIPVGVRGDVSVPGVDPLRYQRPAARPDAPRGELLTVKLRYQRPEGSASRLIDAPVRDVERRDQRLSDDFGFAAAVAEFGMLLRNSEFKGTSSGASVLEMARAHRGEDRDGYRAEFIQLVRAWQTLSGNRTESVGVVE